MFSYYENRFDLPDSLKEFQGLKQVPGPHFEFHCLRARAIDITKGKKSEFPNVVSNDDDSNTNIDS